MVLRKVKDLVRNKFNVSIAQVSEDDRWQRAVLGISLVGGDRRSPSRRSTRCCASSAATCRSRTRRRSCSRSATSWPAPTSSTGRGERCRNGWNGWRARSGRSLGEVLARDEIKDPRVRGAGLITVTHVRVSGDLRHARALFTVHGARRRGAGAGAPGPGPRERLLPPGDLPAAAHEGRPGREVRGRPGVRAGRARREALREDSGRRPAADAERPSRRRRRRGRRRRRAATTSEEVAPVVSDAVLVVDKPIGPTSFDVVRQVRRAAGSGASATAGRSIRWPRACCPICLGEATKLAQFLLGRRQGVRRRRSASASRPTPTTRRAP